MIIGWWQRIFDHYKGDPGKITLLTMGMLCLSETPLYVFTLLDILKLPQLYKYRLHYAGEVSDHLGVRVYPPWNVIKATFKECEFNFLFAYLIPGYLAIKAANKLKIFVYDTDREITYKRLIKETIMISVVADFMFYFVHRIVHQPGWYQFFHKKVSLISLRKSALQLTIAYTHSTMNLNTRWRWLIISWNFMKPSCLRAPKHCRR